MDYTSYTIEELVDLKLVKETALELVKADLDEVADALREKQVSLELANKLNSMTAEEIDSQLKQDVTWNAKTCLEKGLVDEIIIFK